MDAELFARTAAQSARNPFRRARLDPCFTYSLAGETKTIIAGTHQLYQAIFDRSCSETSFISEDAALKVLQRSALQDEVLADLWDDALSATYESLPLADPREGFLNRDEFFIILAGLQEQLGLDDELFKEKISNHDEGNSTQAGSSPGEVTKHLTQKTLPGNSHDYTVTEDAKQVSVRDKILSSVPFDKRSEAASANNQVYADGFTEYSLAFYQPKLPAVARRGNDEKPTLVHKFGARKSFSLQHEPENFTQPLSDWACTSCTLYNPLESLACEACATKCPARKYPDLIDVSNEASTVTQTALINQEDSFKELTSASTENKNKIEPAEKEVKHFSQTLPEAVPIRAAKNNLLTTSDARLDIQTTKFHPSPGIYEIDTSITTSASDAEARSLATALEPKKRKFSVSGFRRNIQNSENSDQAVSGFSLQILAQVLENAAAAGNLPLVASTLNLGADVNYSSRKNKQYHLALHRAALAKHEDIVDYLLRMGANRETSASALYAAINHKAIAVAMKLVPRADFNKMWKSTRLNDSPCYESCISALVSMDQESRQKLLRLMMNQAIFDPENPAMAFVEKIDDLSSPKSCGMTVLACFTAFTNLADVEFLLQQLGETYCIPKRSNSSQYRDPICCISTTYWQQEPADALRMVNLLIKHGAQAGATVSIPGQRKNEYSALTAAIKGGSLEGVQLLLQHGANPESTMYISENHPHDHLSPLSYAVLCGEIDICRALVESGAFPNRANADGSTPLYYACRGGRLELVEYFLSLNVKHSDLHTCLEAAIESNNPKVVRILIEVGAMSTPQVWEQAMSVNRSGAGRNCYIEIIDLLLSMKTKMKIFPRASILTAIDEKNFSGLSRVLEMRNGNLGFDVNEIFQDRRWSNIYMTVKAATLMTRSGSRDVDIKRDDLYNCLAYAEEKDDDDIVTLLRGYGWTSKKGCGPDCEARFGSRYDCDGKPPHTRRILRPPMDEKEVLWIRAGHGIR
ncbi:ankyrin [Stipitochalara longipes BDJ]|nr:ankyrin [Stipitochalara longipes BDJ]